ncbi:MAG: hypothetical protein AAF581_18940 [Planctomycetota bacterium]
MPDEDVRQLLDQLANSAAALHQETESIGTVIRDVEERLRSMNLGIEAWLSEQRSGSLLLFGWISL